MLSKGENAPSFALPDSGGTTVRLGDFKGRYLVVYFYPRDSTPGCTIEAQQFTALLDEFDKANAAVVGISTDSMRSHCAFAEKYSLGVTLLSDESHAVTDAYGAWQQKKSGMGTVRTTVLVGPAGTVERVWENVQADGHAREVLAAIPRTTGS